MKYKLILLFLLCISILGFSQTIEWTKNTKLNTKDFQGEVPKNTINHAATAYNIGYEIVSNSIWTGKIKIRTYATFNKAESWLNESFYTDNLLNHEQKHFDIAQIFACKLQNLINNEIKSSKDYNSKISNLSKVIGDECLRFQEKYDLETDHGTILDTQKKYNTDIERLIEKNCSNK